MVEVVKAVSVDGNKCDSKFADEYDASNYQIKIPSPVSGKDIPYAQALREIADSLKECGDNRLTYTLTVSADYVESMENILATRCQELSDMRATIKDLESKLNQ